MGWTWGLGLLHHFSWLWCVLLFIPSLCTWQDCYNSFNVTDTSSIRLLTIVNDGKLAIWDFDREKKVISKDHNHEGLTLAGLEGNIIMLQSHPTQTNVFIAISAKHAMVRKAEACILRCSLVSWYHRCLKSANQLFPTLHCEQKENLSLRAVASYAMASYPCIQRYVKRLLNTHCTVSYSAIQDGGICTYEIRTPEGVNSGGIVTREGQLYYR